MEAKSGLQSKRLAAQGGAPVSIPEKSSVEAQRMQAFKKNMQEI